VPTLILLYNAAGTGTKMRSLCNFEKGTRRISYVVLTLQRHQSGDWGDVDDHDRQMNADALRNGDWLVSIYESVRGRKF
jgi:hypothetical protein